MRPTVLQYEVSGWGVGELWLVGARVVWSEHPRPRVNPGSDPGQTPAGRGKHGAGSGRGQTPRRNVQELRRIRDESEGSDPGQTLVGRLQRFFGGAPDDFADVDLDFDDAFYSGFYGECAAALRRIPRGEVITYGELAALAGHPRAARAAGTFCARNRLGVFIPCHRVVGADGIGQFGDLGVAYKRRMLALEGVLL